MGVITRWRKFVRYAFDARSLTFTPDPGAITDHALRTAKLIRGPDRSPALIIHGIMKRSGTVYTGALLRQHPDLCPYPRDVWEVPLLPRTGDILKTQKDFFFDYEQNIGKIGEQDFLPLFGAAMIAYLHLDVPENKRMLLKMPSVQYLNYFYSMFPYESLLVLVRDGRDVVTSTIRTWPQIRFSLAARRWNLSARMVLNFHRHHSEREGYWMTKFEDIVKDPGAFVKEACRHFGLDEGKYPYEAIDSIPVQGSSSFKERGKARYFVPKPKGFDPIGRWQEWPAGKKQIFKRIAGQTLMELGYCENLDW